MNNKFLANYSQGFNPYPVKGESAFICVRSNAAGNSEIWKINYETGVEECIVSHPDHNFTSPCISPDGQWLYFVSDRGGSPQIYRQAISGGQAERVTFGADYAVSPTLSPDGAQLCYVTRVDGRYRVAVMELATGQEKILTGNDFDESPSFAPNGRMIVFASERGRKGVLGTVSIDGSVSAWLSTATGDIREPTWGPLLA